MADAICVRLALGESLRAICKADSMPAPSTVCRWVVENAAFAEQYARARNIGLDVLADQVLEVADGESWDTGAVARDRLKFDARRWYLSKLAPKRYGERIAHEVEGTGGGPVRVEHGVDADPDRLAALATLIGEITGSGS